MLHAYQLDNRALRRMDREAPLTGAVWIDLYRPLPEQVAAVEALGIAVPTLADACRHGRDRDLEPALSRG